MMFAGRLAHVRVSASSVASSEPAGLVHAVVHAAGSASRDSLSGNGFGWPLGGFLNRRSAVRICPGVSHFQGLCEARSVTSIAPIPVFL